METESHGLDVDKDVFLCNCVCVVVELVYFVYTTVNFNALIYRSVT